MEEENKKNKRNIIIIVIALISIICLFIILFILVSRFMNQPSNNSKEELPKWGKKYYNYLKDFSEESKPLLKENDVEIREVYKANLYNYSDISEEPPLLTLDPALEEQKEDYLILVLMIDNEPKDFVIKQNNATIEMLYNVKEEKSYYYFIYQENNQTHFIKLTDYINYLLDNNYKYEETIINNGEKINVNGEEILKVDTIFIEPNTPEIQFDYKPEEIKSLEDDFSYYIKDVKKSEKLLKNNNENGVNEKLDRIKTIIVEIEKQQKEPEQKEPEPKEPEPAPNPDDPSITDPNNCTGWNPNYAANPCLCENFTGCVNDLFEHSVCGIGYCSSKQPMTEEECLNYGGELSGDTCWTPYK